MVNDPNVNDDANEIDDRSYEALEALFQPEEDDQDVEILEDLIDD